MVACLSPFTTVSVFREQADCCVTFQLTLLDMHLECVHWSLKFCSWPCSLGVGGQWPVIFITNTPAPHHPPISGNSHWHKSPKHINVCSYENQNYVSLDKFWCLTCSQLLEPADKVVKVEAVLRVLGGFTQSGHPDNVVCHTLALNLWILYLKINYTFNTLSTMKYLWFDYNRIVGTWSWECVVC